MSFIDEVYSLYRDQLIDNEEDAVAVAISLLEEQSKENIIQLIHEMSDDELIQMMGVYIIEMLKIKMVKDGKLQPWKTIIFPPCYH
jgi:hypothetical protein